MREKLGKSPCAGRCISVRQEKSPQVFGGSSGGCGSSLQPGPAPLAAPTHPAGDVALLFIAFFPFFSFHIIFYLSNRNWKKGGGKGIWGLPHPSQLWQAQLRCPSSGQTGIFWSTFNSTPRNDSPRGNVNSFTASSSERNDWPTLFKQKYGKLTPDPQPSPSTGCLALSQEESS